MGNEERINMLENEMLAMKEELRILRESEHVNREVLDANVTYIYQRMKHKHNAKILCFSSIVSCVLLVVSQIITNEGFSWNVLSIYLIVMCISVGIMIITIIKD